MSDTVAGTAPPGARRGRKVHRALFAQVSGGTIWLTQQQRRGRTRWIVDVEQADGKRRQLVARTKEARAALAEEVKTELVTRHGHPGELPTETTWAELFERVMAHRADLKPRTLEGYRDLNRLHLAPTFGATPVTALTRLRLKEFLQQQLGRYARHTVRLQCALLHLVLAEAADTGLVPVNVATGLAKKLKLGVKQRARQDATTKKAMTAAQRDAFLDTARRLEPWWSPAWELQVRTGLRPGELYALSEDDLDLDAGTLRVARSLADDGSRVDTPKGGVSRLVDLTPGAVAVLRAQLQRNRDEGHERGWPDLPRPPVFCDHTGGHADPANVRRAFRRVAKEAGLVTEAGAPAFTPHGLRHTYAALLLQATGDVYYTSQQLGHASIELTVSTYGAWHQAHRRPALDVLDRRHDHAPTRRRSARA